MLGDMLTLPDDFPEIYDEFMKGNFATQLSDQSVFSRVETDKVIEMTLNKDTKTPGGTTGFSTNVSAVKRWALSASYRAALRTCFHGHLIYKPQHYKHSDLMPSRIQKDEKDVNTLVCLLNDVFVNPFSEQPLLSISTGIAVPEMICKDLLEAERVGKETMETFITKRLTKEREASIFDTIKKLKLKTFDSMKKTKTYKLKDKTIDLQATKDIFSKVAIIAQKRSIVLKQLFEYPLGPLPWSLAEADGTLKKTAKATLLHKIEGEVKPVNDIVDAYAFIADGMACVRHLKVCKITYRQLAVNLLKYILGISKSANRVDIVFDVYVNNSIKDVERMRRSSGELMLNQIIATSEVKQWNLLLSSNENKNKLCEFLVKEWKSNIHLIKDKCLFVTCKEEVFQFINNEITSIPELWCDHQEADTRMLVHANHASLSYQSVVIHSPDTDVFILALAKSLELESNLFMDTGTKQTRRIIDITAVGDEVFTTMCNADCSKDMFFDALLGYHSFTGCDTTSAFAEKGKIKPLKIMSKEATYIEAFSTIGKDRYIDEQTKEALEKFVCEMFGSKSSNNVSSCVNRQRYKMYCSKGGRISSSSLLPCKNVLMQHINRSNYQAWIWKHCLKSMIEVDSPIHHGWFENEGKLDVLWMTCSPTPEEVLGLISCSCKKKCSNRCSCITNDFVCTDACLCTDCDNVKDLDVSDSDSYASNSDDDCSDDSDEFEY